MGHVEGRARNQRLLLSPSLDEVLSSDHPVRVVDAFVDTLDLKALGFSKVEAEEMGRPSYRPGDLAKLYVYGYANRIRSSRGLEREARRNLEVQWLVNQVTPSFKTIADFRRDHPEALVAVTGAFVQFCRGQGLYGAEMVAIDGTKIEAVASRQKVVTPARLQKQIAAIEAKVAEHLAAMDAADREEASAEAQVGDVAAALEALKAQREALQAKAKALADKGLTQEVEGEADARLMKTARHGHQVAYNAQSAVDAKHGLIAAFDLTNDCNDHNQLLPMAEAAKEALDAETLTAVADTGYSNGEQGLACEAADITAIVPRAQTVNPRNPEFFTREAFAYDEESDSFTCPAGETLTLATLSQTEQKAYYSTKACAGCQLKARCTNAARRTITRGFYEGAKEAMHRRAMADPIWMKRRRALAEHPFGMMKALMGYPRFLVRGLQKARSELALTILGFNLKRAINIRGVPALLEALSAQPV
ncbi:MAG: Transposase domain protein [Caulobacteraceae bacterium]|nr:Transposase domain protein [Caulobacteraceae bacterium]